MVYLDAQVTVSQLIPMRKRLDLVNRNAKVCCGKGMTAGGAFVVARSQHVLDWFQDTHRIDDRTTFTTNYLYRHSFSTL